MAEPKRTLLDRILKPLGYTKAYVNPPAVKKPPFVNLPAGRISEPLQDNKPFYQLSDNLRMVEPAFVWEVIPIIRKLCMVNEDMSQALDNIVRLGNTGHEIYFDEKVDEAQIIAMRAHLEDKKSKGWTEGVAGTDGLVNKMFAQIIIGGALSSEWVPDLGLKTITNVFLVNPEQIRWVYDTVKQRYIPYQKILHPNVQKIVDDNLIKLNPNTYQYLALNGDDETPYGVPPYMSALDSVGRQRKMLDNISFIIEQLGLMGFLEVLIDKPDQQEGESNDNYIARLTSLLQTAKVNTQAGFRDGVTIGFKNDHEFEFHPVAGKFSGGVGELFEQNELQIASGLKTDAALLGRGYATSETQITVVFTKMISQLKNIQNIVKTNLEFGYRLELLLAGFNPTGICVEFNASTLLDKYKEAQTQEIEIRNVNAKYNMGIISQDQQADELGYEQPDQDGPRIPDFALTGATQTTPTPGDTPPGKQAQKNKSAKRTRDNNKHRPRKL